jgi:hypothetical protein
MAISAKEQASRYRTAQAVVLFASLVFFTVIAYGWYHMAMGGGWFIAIATGSVMAGFAWFLAKMIGTTPNGPWKRRSNLIVLAGLLAISAVGVYNTIMVNSEGEQILTDSVAEAQASFSKLENVANAELDKSGANARIRGIETLKANLADELRDPTELGQGGDASVIIGRLRRELPGFEPLDGAGSDEGAVSQLVEVYNRKIDELLARADWNDQGMNGVRSGAREASANLGKLQQDILTNYEPSQIPRYHAQLESFNSKYGQLYRTLQQRGLEGDMPNSLDLISVQSLGDPLKVIALFLSRMTSSILTWAYLALAIAFDLFMVSMFAYVTAIRPEEEIDPSFNGNA